MKSSIDFDQVIQNHSHWKYLLKQAIAQGQSEHTVIHTRDAHHCAFGKWLYSPAGKTLPHYLKVVELHQHFHEEAGKVLKLALLRHSNEALDGLKLGSPFNQASANLINQLCEIRETMESVKKG